MIGLKLIWLNIGLATLRTHEFNTDPRDRARRVAIENGLEHVDSGAWYDRYAWRSMLGTYTIIYDAYNDEYRKG